MNNAQKVGVIGFLAGVVLLPGAFLHAADVRESTGVSAGLVLHLGCGDGAFTTQLAVPARRLAEFQREVAELGDLDGSGWGGELQRGASGADGLDDLVGADQPPAGKLVGAGRHSEDQQLAAAQPASSGPRGGAGSSAAAAAGLAVEAPEEVRGLLARSRALLDRVHAEDKEELIDLHERIEQATRAHDHAALSAAAADLKELLFFIEGK